MLCRRWNLGECKRDNRHDCGNGGFESLLWFSCCLSNSFQQLKLNAKNRKKFVLFLKSPRRKQWLVTGHGEASHTEHRWRQRRQRRPTHNRFGLIENDFNFFSFIKILIKKNFPYIFCLLLVLLFGCVRCVGIMRERRLCLCDDGEDWRPKWVIVCAIAVTWDVMAFSVALLVGD